MFLSNEVKAAVPNSVQRRGEDYSPCDEYTHGWIGRHGVRRMKAEIEV